MAMPLGAFDMMDDVILQSDRRDRPCASYTVTSFRISALGSTSGDYGKRLTGGADDEA